MTTYTTFTLFDTSCCNVIVRYSTHWGVRNQTPWNYHVTGMGSNTRGKIEIRSNASTNSTTMSDAEAATAAPRRSQRDKKQVERFGSGAHSPSRPSRGGILIFGFPLDNTKKRKRAESGSDTPEPASDSDSQGVEGEEEDEEPPKAKPKRKAASPAKAKPKASKPKAPPQKKPKIPKTMPAKTGPKATKRARRPKGGDTGEPFDAEKLAKDTHISGDNPLFSTWWLVQTRVALTILTQMLL